MESAKGLMVIGSIGGLVLGGRGDIRGPTDASSIVCGNYRWSKGAEAHAKVKAGREAKLKVESKVEVQSKRGSGLKVEVGSKLGSGPDVNMRGGDGERGGGDIGRGDGKRLGEGGDGGGEGSNGRKGVVIVDKGEDEQGAKSGIRRDDSE
ncbi:unnamed protein product [Calypogeia fissa]